MKDKKLDHEINMNKANKLNQEINLIEHDLSRIIEMAWEDRTSFDAIKLQFGLNESQVKALMKKNLKFGSYKLWRKRVENCKTKHDLKRVAGMKRFKSKAQKLITNNTISKRK